ncbi:MAG: hypothetical protein U0836_14005 [Pirellulales bacterium]
MPSNANATVWPGSLEAAAFYEEARALAEELLRQLHELLRADAEEGGEFHWGHVGQICQINALLAEALRVPGGQSESASS